MLYKMFYDDFALSDRYGVHLKRDISSPFLRVSTMNVHHFRIRVTHGLDTFWRRRTWVGRTGSWCEFLGCHFVYMSLCPIFVGFWAAMAM